MQLLDKYCDATISAAFIANGAEDMIGGTECGVEEHIKKFIKKKIWEEDGSITPKKGYLIVFNWDNKTQPNDGTADHIGIVESVVSGMITTIEGNMGGKVGRRRIAVGDGVIRGYAIPDYIAEEEIKKGWTGETGKAWKYSDDGVSYVKNAWRMINFHWYFFGSDGVAYTGAHRIEGKLYYFATAEDSVECECSLMRTFDTKNGNLELWRL